MKSGVALYLQKIKSFEREAKLFLITSFVLQFLNGGYQVVYNLYLSALGYGSDFIGMVGSIRLVVGALVAIPLGIMTTRIGYRRSLWITGIIIVFSIFGLANTNSQFLIFTLSIIWGLAFVLRGILTAPFLSNHSTLEERAHLFGITFSLHMWAGMLGNFLGGSLTQGLQQTLGTVGAYQGALNVFGAVSLLGMIPIFFLKPDQTVKDEKFSAILRNVGRVVRNREVISLLIYNALIGTGAGLVVPLFNIFLRMRLHASDFEIGTLMSLTQIATSIGCLLTPGLIRMFGQSMAVVVSQFLSIPFLIVVGSAPSFTIVCGAYLLRHSLMNMVNPIINSVGMQVVGKDDRPTASSLIQTMNNMGRGAGMYLSGIMFAGGKYLLPYVITCVLYLSGSLVFYFSFRNRTQVTDSATSTTAG